MNALGFDPAQSSQQFMNLLVAQIQYQDPLEPVSQENMTAQLAQISTVSGISEMTAGISNLNLRFSEMLNMQTLFDGANLVGRHVQFNSPVSGQQATGEISEARLSNGQLALTVNGQNIGLSDVIAVVSNAA
ncbi:MAG: flagellar hook capping FlgD N-terminal domain-containing protein [Planctomycetaceae bacterium]